MHSAKKGRGFGPCVALWPSGLGKTTLSHIIANEMGLKSESLQAAIESGRSCAILTNLSDNSILLLMKYIVLTTAWKKSFIRHGRLFFGHGRAGPSARTIRLSLPKFTLRSHHRAGMLSSPLRDRFGVMFRLSFITKRSLPPLLRVRQAFLNINIDAQAAQEIARRSRGTPRIANRLLKGLEILPNTSWI